MVVIVEKGSCMIKHTSMKYLLVLLGFSSLAQAVPYYPVRSQSQDSARELVGLAREIHLYRPDACDMYKVFDVAFEYSRTFDSKEIAQCLFGQACLTDCECPTIKISGPDVENRGEKDWDASYFGLPDDFQSTITFRPRIENYLVDFYWYFGFDQWCKKGVYLKIHAPVVHTKWKLNYCETITNPGSMFDENEGTTRAVQSFSDWVSEEQVANGDEKEVFKPLGCSRWASRCDRLHETKLSDIQLAFGWDFLQCCDHYLGLSVRAAIPTGNRPDCIYLFEPIVGNGHHWELGAGLNAYRRVWQDCDNGREVGFYLEAQVTHLFKDRQCRVFDLKQGCNTRYICAVRDWSQTLNSTSINVESPVANLTKIPIDVSINYQADVTAMFSYLSCCYTWDFGYNFWARGCEKISLDDFVNCDDCPCRLPFSDERRWLVCKDTNLFKSEDSCPETVPLTLDLIDFCAARTKSMSHKLFGFVSYKWCEDECGKHYFAGVGGFVEWGQNDGCDPCCDPTLVSTTTSCSTDCDDVCNPCDSNDCVQCTPSRWGLWFKAGVAYN